MNASALPHTTLATGVPEEGTVSDCGLIRHDTGISLVRVPTKFQLVEHFAPRIDIDLRIKMRVKVNNRNWAVHSLQATKNGQYDGVIATETNDSWVFPLIC